MIYILSLADDFSYEISETLDEPGPVEWVTIVGGTTGQAVKIDFVVDDDLTTLPTIQQAIEFVHKKSADVRMLVRSEGGAVALWKEYDHPVATPTHEGSINLQ